MTEPERFKDREITFANGARGVNVGIPSHSPLNYHQVISQPDAMPAVTVDGKLFLPINRQGPSPCVIIAAGSVGVSPSHMAHAETLNELGFAVFVLDSFGVRGVSSTVANQTQFSFAASAIDVLRAYEVLAAMPEIDGARIGAQGHSRGGSAVLTAATRAFADPVAGEGRGLSAVYAAYPWSGHQFLSPSVGETEIRAIHGDVDEWCSPMQVQGHLQAMRASGGTATMHIVGGAQHSFDRGAPVYEIPEASVTPAAPTGYIADNGAFLHPLSKEPDPALVDRDLMIYAVKAGFGRKGAKMGGSDDLRDLFVADMCAFWQRVMQ